MDFHQLLAKMQELDTPATPAVQPEASVQECGEPMGMTPPMGATQPPHNPPSLSVNLNAQGMDDIEAIMKLMTKVNPDMINQPSPAAAPVATMSPIPSLGSLGNLDSGPLKMLPDLDNEPKGEPMDEPGDDKMNGPDNVSIAQGDLDNDGDHDMDDHEMEKDHEDDEDEAFNPEPQEDEAEEDEEEQEEAFGNSPIGASDVQYKDTEYMVKDLAGGMNREKQQFKHSYRAGDNPMSMSESDLRAYIKAELAQRLEEAKTKLSK